MQDVSISVDDLIMPVFIDHNIQGRQPIDSMPDIYRHGLDALTAHCQDIQDHGIHTLLLFGIPKTKDSAGHGALGSDSVVAQAIHRIKSSHASLLLIADLCLCEYTDHGACCVHNTKGKIDLNQTIDLLCKQAVDLCRAGADVIAPSGMMDGAVHAIRQALDAHGFDHIAIFNYGVKFASHLYGPFRQAADCRLPKGKDRKTYQMDFASRFQALSQAQTNLDDQADAIIIKPAMAYGDIIHDLHTRHPQIPIIAYQVSGEYSMLKHAIDHDLIDPRSLLEMAIALKRAGACGIITYGACQLARMLEEQYA